jgi:nitrogenase iron protein NifH
MMTLIKSELKPLDFTRTIAIYGKGGIGKSTTTANMAAASSKLGLSTMVVGCDPKADSIHALTDEKYEIRTILETIRRNGSSLESLKSCLYRGFNDILCVESGGPAPGVGCAGKGVAVALELLRDNKIFDETLKLILFDVLGDVVCGGFAQPMRSNFAKEVYVVTSGEYMSIYQAVNIASSIANMAKDGVDVRMAGIICNKRNVSGEDEIVDFVSEQIGVPVIMHIPRMSAIQEAEAIGKTVIEVFPNSEASQVYYDLASRIYNNKQLVIPSIENRSQILDKVKKLIGRCNKNEEHSKICG